MSSTQISTRRGRHPANGSYALLAALLGSVVLGAGCETTHATRDAITSEAETQAEFERGAQRPPTADTLYRMARILAAQGKDRQAVAVLEVAIDRDPSFAPAYRELAEIHLRTRRLAQGIEVLRLGISQVPNDPVLLNDLGMAYFIDGQHAQALEQFEKAHDLVPHNARYVSNMAMATALLGDYDRSLDLYRRVVPPAIAHYNVAVLCEANGDQSRAVQEYARALEIDPKYQEKLEAGTSARQPAGNGN